MRNRAPSAPYADRMARPRIPDQDGVAAVTGASSAAEPDRATLATAVRYLLQCLAEAQPGRSVELRVPPFGAVQLIEGPRHTRGTPPNVVEMPADVLLALATGDGTWAQSVATGRIHASGSRSNLSALFPITLPPIERPPTPTADAR